MRLAATLAAVLALVVAAAPAAAATSGLSGIVRRGPIMPVCRVGVPCTARAADVVLVFRRGGSARRTKTDAHGRYRIALSPGTWTVSLTTTGIGSAIAPRRVDVTAGRFRVVDLSIDTGIR